MKDIAQLTEASIEPTEPWDTILTYLRSIDGKKLTKRDIPKIEALTGPIRLYIREEYGNLYLAWWRPTTTGTYAGGEWDTLTIDRGGMKGGTSRTIDAAKIERDNACHFAAKYERNAKRAQLLATYDARTFGQSHPFVAAADAMKRLAQATKDLEDLTDGPLSVIRYELAK